jgi:hypothetical protein
VTCSGSATCLVRSQRTPTVVCSGGAPRRCNGDVYTCNRDCPP